MRKGRRERIEKGSKEGIEKETKRQFEEKEGFPPPSKFGFYKLIECIIKKMSWCETECKKNVPFVKQNVMKF